MTILDWTNYFSNLASKHTSLQHSATSKHFFRGELDEFWQDIRSKAKFPALMLESSLLDITSETSSFSSTRTLAFVIVDNCKVDRYQSITQVHSQCEVIATSILERIRHDIHEGELGTVRLLSAHLEPIENVPMHYYGQRVELVVSEFNCYYVPNVWTDEED